MASYTFDTLLDFDIARIVLPSGYTKLNYIENQGNSYMLLNYKANNNTIVETILSYNSTSGDQVPYGCDYWYGYRNSGFIVFLSPSLNVDFGNQRINLNKSIDIDTWYTFQQSQDGFFLNGNKLTNFNSQTFTCTNNFAIFTFGANLSGNSFLKGKMKAISVKDLTENFELIACENQNNEIGMYDVVTDTFFANQGTNPFISGGTAPTITPIAGDTATITSTGDVYKYEGDAWQLWYTIIPPLVFRGFSFEQTDFWQIPEMVFRGLTFEQTDFWQIPEMVFRGLTFEQTDFWQIPEISFEITDKVGGASMFHGMS